MYTVKNTMEYIIGKNPEFQEYLNIVVTEWTAGDRTFGLDISTFSDFISDKLEKREEYDFKAVFDLVEVLLVDGDKEVSISVGMQFLENLLNLSANGYFSIDSFFPYLGEESKAFCKSNEEFWGIESSQFYKDK